VVVSPPSVASVIVAVASESVVNEAVVSDIESVVSPSGHLRLG
jgi:hypothetical protein